MKFSTDRWAVKLVSFVIVLSMVCMTALPLATGDDLFEIASGEGDSGAGTTSNFGWNVSKAGDVNGDGIDDFIVGAPNADYLAVTDCGAAFIYFGYDGIQDADLNASNANVSIYGTAASGHFGWDVADAGDVNGGNVDIIIGEPDNGNGKAYIYYGSGAMSATMTTADADVTITGEASGDDFGKAGPGAGNTDDSGNADVIVGAPEADSAKGAAYIFYDSSMAAAIAAGNADVIMNGKHTDGKFGSSVSSAGNTDGVGGTEVVIGEPGSDRAYVYYPPSDQTANADDPVFGTVGNDYTYTQSSNNGYEIIEEEAGAGGRVDLWGTHDMTTGIPTGWSDYDAGGSVSANTWFALAAPTTPPTQGDAPVIWINWELPYNNRALETEAFDFATYSGVEMNFEHFMNAAYLDDLHLEWDNTGGGAGGTWNLIQTWTADGTWTDWTIRNAIDCSAVDGLSDVRFRFRYEATDGNSNGIDYVKVTGNEPTTSKLEHKWTIPVTTGGTFYIEANRTDKLEGDTLNFYYSLTGTGTVGDTGAGWVSMMSQITIPTNGDPNSYQTYSDSTLDTFTGTLYIGVVDADRTSGLTLKDVLCVDHMFVRGIPFKELVGERITQNTDYTATADSAVSGTVTPSTDGYQKTQATDDDYESIQEISVAATYDYDYTTDEWFTQSDSHTNDHTATQVQGGNTEDIVELSVPGAPVPTTETRYMRGDQHTINTLTAYQLGTTQSSTARSSLLEQTGAGGGTVNWGIRVWGIDSDGTETEITSGTPVAQVSRATAGEGIQSNTWACPQTGITDTDAIVVRVYAELSGVIAWTEQAEFISEQLGATLLEDVTWTVYYYTQYATVSGGAPGGRYTRGWFHWGDAAHDSRIDNFVWSVPGPAHYSLEQKWQFTDTPLAASQYEFHAFVGWDGAGAGDDTFEYWYSTTGADPVGGAGWTLMFTDSTSAVNEQTFDLDNDGYTGGALYVGVIDTDSSGDGQDTLIVDYLYVETVITPAYSSLEHKWTFAGVTAGTDTTFYLEAYRTNLDAENMEFYYSTSGSGSVSTWTPMFDVTATSDPGPPGQTFSDAILDAYTGTLYVGVIDASSGDTNQDTIYIDHMYFRASGSALPSDFGFDVANMGNINDDGSGTPDIAITDPTGNNGYTYIWEDGNFEGSSSREDTDLAHFTASGSSLADGSNPSNNIFATSGGDLNLSANIIFEDDFEDDFAGQDPDDPPWGIPTEDAGTNVEISGTVSQGGSQSMMLDDDASADTTGCSIVSDNFAATTAGVIEFWARCTDQVSASEQFVISARSGTTDAILVGFMEDSFCYEIGTTVTIFGSYTQSQWYHFKLVFDAATVTYDYYIDDVLRWDDLDFTNAVASINNIEITTKPFNFVPDRGATQALGYIDDIIIYEPYDTPGYYTSSTTTAPGYITAVKPFWNLTTPGGTTAWLNISRDGGITWNQSALTNGYWYTFPSEGIGKELCYKIEMSTTNTITPVLQDVTLYYKYCTPASITFTGTGSGDKFGFSAASAGDIDGDGIDDLLVGAPYNDTADGTNPNGGGVFAFCGGAYLSGTISASNANYTFYGGTAGDMLGYSVGTIGNFNSHGNDDVIVGIPFNNSNAGSAIALSIALPMKTAVSFTVEEHGLEPEAKVNISWTKVNGATKYNIYRSDTPWGFDFGTPDATVDAPALSWVDTNAPRNTANPHNATSYYYAVRAENALAEKGPYKIFAIHRMDLVDQWNFITWLSNETMDIETEAFANLEADDGANPTTFIYDKVERWDPASQADWESYTTDGDLGPFSDMAPGYAYAINCRVDAVWTYVEDCGVPSISTADDSALAAPGSFTLARNGANPSHVDLSWNTVATADHYNIYRSFTKWGFDFNNPIHSTADGAVTSWTDTTSTQENGAYNASVYYYIIRTVDASGDIEKNLNAAAMHRMDFRNGINYMSWTPHETVSEETALASLVPFVDYISVEQWDESTQVFNPAVANFERGYGYGINAIQACTWTYVEYA